MTEAEKFVELVEHICKRPRMFTMGGTFGEIVAYLTGYAAGAPNCPIGGGDDRWRAFNRFVTATCRAPENYCW